MSESQLCPTLDRLGADTSTDSGGPNEAVSQGFDPIPAIHIVPAAESDRVFLQSGSSLKTDPILSRPERSGSASLTLNWGSGLRRGTREIRRPPSYKAAVD